MSVEGDSNKEEDLNVKNFGEKTGSDNILQKTFSEVLDEFADVSLVLARERFEAEYFTEMKKNSFLMFTKDFSLNFQVVESEEIPTACINLETGEVKFGKGLVLACLEGKRRMMNFIK